MHRGGDWPLSLNNKINKTINMLINKQYANSVFKQ